MADTPNATPDTPKETLAKLDRQERTTGRSGALPRAPKQQMLDASDVAAKRPDKHLRWVSLKDPNKLASRKLEGYTAVPEKEGGRAIGDEYVLMEIPREVYEQRLAQYKETHEMRLDQHNRDWENLAEGVARELRDRHGLKVDPRTLTRA